MSNVYERVIINMIIKIRPVRLCAASEEEMHVERRHGRLEKTDKWRKRTREENEK